MNQFKVAITIIAVALPLFITQPSQAVAQPDAGEPASRRAFGVDLAGMDPTVKPGDDFYLYANGAWQAKASIPDDRPQVGAYSSLIDSAFARVHHILAATSAGRRSKAGQFYASYMDEDRTNAKGLAPVQPVMAEIAVARDKVALASIMADLQKDGVTGLFAPFVEPDDRNPTAYVLYFEQDGLGLPDRSYYLENDRDSTAGRAAYAAYIARLFALAGQDDAGRRIAAVMAFETGVARTHWDGVAERDELKVYNRYGVSELKADEAGFDWDAYLKALGASTQSSVIIREPSAFSAAARSWSQTPLAVLKDWLLIRYLDQNAGYLPAPFAEASFAFHDTTLSGTTKAKPRWERGASLVAHKMEDGIGRAYAEAYFPPSAKAQIEAIVSNVKRAFRERLANETWMSEATRQKAIEKLDTFQVVVGYPDRWRDDSGLRISANDLVGNVARAERYTFADRLRRLGTTVDRRQFDNSAALPWAWATPTLNEIGFSAAFLRSPYFDPEADPAINYGAIGAVIGHELSHHFDDQGRKHDAQGRLADWWTPEDAVNFAARTKALVSQYDAYQPLPGLHVNGALTLGENLADLAGLNISYQAYIESLGGKPAPVIDGFTGPQRFFLGDAQSRRSKQRDADLRNQVLSDPHPPEKERSQEVRNIDAWYQAFHVLPGDAMYLPPDQRVRVW